MKLVLASASPRRRDLLRLFGLPFETRIATVDEESIDHPEPAVNVVLTARLKAESIMTQDESSDLLVIASDTTVALDGQMLNKPADAAEAAAMLRTLRGRTHQVHTGLVVMDKASGRRVEDVATVNVPMRQYSQVEIEAYVETGDPMDKAGAYAIQHPIFKPVTELTDCYAAVMGLPLCHLFKALDRLGYPQKVNIAKMCQNYNSYDCPVYETILKANINLA